jgi:hypothetical protein
MFTWNEKSVCSSASMCPFLWHSAPVICHRVACEGMVKILDLGCRREVSRLGLKISGLPGFQVSIR